MSTKQKILTAIAYLSLHGLKVNKRRVSQYTNLSWLTVHRHLEKLYEDFKLKDIEHFNKSYERRLRE